MTEIAAYKGFDRDLKCRGFQYKEGETYEHDGPVRACHSGFHAVRLPLEMFTFCPPTDGNRHHKVTLDGDADEETENSKIAAGKITIGAQLNIFDIVKAHIEIIAKKKDTTSGNSAHSATSGYGATRATVEGRGAVAAVLGEGAARGAVGCWIVLTERDQDLDIVEVRAVQIDGETVKADTFYELAGGILVEVAE